MTQKGRGVSLRAARHSHKVEVGVCTARDFKTLLHLVQDHMLPSTQPLQVPYGFFCPSLYSAPLQAIRHCGLLSNARSKPGKETIQNKPSPFHPGTHLKFLFLFPKISGSQNLM